MLPAVLISLCRGYKWAREGGLPKLPSLCVACGQSCVLLNLEKSKELALEGPQGLPFIVQGRNIGVQGRRKNGVQGKESWARRRSFPACGPRWPVVQKGEGGPVPHVVVQPP